MLFSKTGLQEGLHRHAPVREGGGWCPRQQWVLPAIVIVVNVSIIIIIHQVDIVHLTPLYPSCL